ncbi:hypothetical protein [Amycolatopsis sp. NPDC049159]|uniref:hypothetical protein n=1 Tax=Amycolatopsis sp. NPDC049159 TaxID=3157210 RepID=UPI0033FB0EE2
MTELQQYQGGGDIVAQSALPAAAGALVEWAQALRSAKQIADALCVTAFCPQQFRNKPEEAAAAILAGSEIGLSPRASMNSFDIIQGSAAPRAVTLRAVVQSHGHDLWVVESTNTRAIVKGRRAGSDAEHTSTWTMDRARGLGLHTKDNWKKQPGAMLVARATAECARFVASDAILGIAYTAEELADTFEPEPAAVGRASVRRRATTTRVSRPALTGAAPATVESAGEPPLPGDEVPPVEPAAPITEPQMKKMQAIFTNAGVDRDVRLAASSAILQREISTASDLTKDEATVLIDTLEGLGEGEDLTRRIEELADPTLPGDPDLQAGGQS